MYIVWDQAAAAEMQKKHTLLELEYFDVKGIQVKTWCVVPAEKLIADGFEHLENNKNLHSAFVKAYYDADYRLCRDLAEHLVGKFGGELDTFYEEILSRINKT
jgi:hypothetical protein